MGARRRLWLSQAGVVLTAWASHVHALDRSSVMLDQVRGRCPEALNLMWLESDLLDPAVPLRDAGYDAMTAVSSLHHMPLQAALAASPDSCALEESWLWLATTDRPPWRSCPGRDPAAGKFGCRCCARAPRSGGQTR
ncbi:MAG TPA: class I SAM-dependent methyltransferase [Propionibacteriaceae bacterium]|nr:class I SAM-dependent methyltransferase [Propionibacteriaceae bacterium]